MFKAARRKFSHKHTCPEGFFLKKAWFCSKRGSNEGITSLTTSGAEGIPPPGDIARKQETRGTQVAQAHVGK